MTDNKTDMRKCIRCGIEIPSHGGKKYCIDCAKIHNRERARELAVEKRIAQLTTTTCYVCGKEFTPSARWKYCSDECGTKAQRSLSAEYKKLHREDVQRPTASATRYRAAKMLWEKPLTLAEVAAAATAAGLSYGQYMAQLTEERENQVAKKRSKKQKENL